MIIGETEGLVKVIAERGPDGRAGRILGVHMVGPWVTEQLGQGYLAVNWEATVDEVAQFLQPHPTSPSSSGRPSCRSPAERIAPMRGTVDVTMPQLGETVTEGTITRWLKQVGDHVDADEVLFEVSTDKVDSEVPAPTGGVLTEILVPEGDTVDVGTVLAVVSDGADGAAEAPGAPADGRPRRRLPPTPPRWHRRPSPRRPPPPAPAPAPAPAEAPRHRSPPPFAAPHPPPAAPAPARGLAPRRPPTPGATPPAATSAVVRCCHRWSGV